MVANARASLFFSSGLRSQALGVEVEGEGKFQLDSIVYDMWVLSSIWANRACLELGDGTKWIYSFFLLLEIDS